MSFNYNKSQFDVDGFQELSPDEIAAVSGGWVDPDCVALTTTVGAGIGFVLGAGFGSIIGAGLGAAYGSRLCRNSF